MLATSFSTDLFTLPQKFLEFESYCIQLKDPSKEHLDQVTADSELFQRSTDLKIKNKSRLLFQIISARFHLNNVAKETLKIQQLTSEIIPDAYLKTDAIKAPLSLIDHTNLDEYESLVEELSTQTMSFIIASQIYNEIRKIKSIYSEHIRSNSNLPPLFITAPKKLDSCLSISLANELKNKEGPLKELHKLNQSHIFSTRHLISELIGSYTQSLKHLLSKEFPVSEKMIMIEKMTELSYLLASDQTTSEKEVFQILLESYGIRFTVVLQTPPLFSKFRYELERDPQKFLEIPLFQ